MFCQFIKNKTDISTYLLISNYLMMSSCFLQLTCESVKMHKAITAYGLKKFKDFPILSQKCKNKNTILYKKTQGLKLQI